MSTSIAILGASGSVGSTLAAQLLRSELLDPGDRLQLVGHGIRGAERKLLSTRIDLMDAFDDDRVEIEVVPNIADVEADIVVVAAGATVSAQCSNRRELGTANRALFEHIGEECARRTQEALFVVVSNPVELAVQILAAKLGRKHIVGMGAQQDSLRFGGAVARDLDISRYDVRASVFGEHGQAMVPLWSTVELMISDPSVHAALATLKKRSANPPLHERVATLQAAVSQHLEDENISEAYELTRRALPDARIFVQPFITAHAMHSTPNATANATLQCLSAALADDWRRVHCQVPLEGEVLDIHGVCGIPVALNRSGWRHQNVDSLTTEEKESILQSAKSIQSFVSGILSQPPMKVERATESQIV
jgi:malate dehydrogenase